MFLRVPELGLFAATAKLVYSTIHYLFPRPGQLAFPPARGPGEACYRTEGRRFRIGGKLAGG